MPLRLASLACASGPLHALSQPAFRHRHSVPRECFRIVCIVLLNNRSVVPHVQDTKAMFCATGMCGPGDLSCTTFPSPEPLEPRSSSDPRTTNGARQVGQFGDLVTKDAICSTATRTTVTLPPPYARTFRNPHPQLHHSSVSKQI